MASEISASLKDLLPHSEEEEDNLALLTKLRRDGEKLKVDLSIPSTFEVDIMASMMIDHLQAYHTNRQAWRAARNGPDHSLATRLFQQMNYNQLTIAILQAEYPDAKVLADEIMKVRAAVAKAQRQQTLQQQALQQNTEG